VWIVKAPKVFALTAMAALLVAGAIRAADDVEVPSFKKAKDKDTKDFQKSVFEAVVKSLRSQPTEVTLEKAEYVKVKEGRKELKLSGTFKGRFAKLVSKKPHKADVTIKLDTLDEKAWEVLEVIYKDDVSGLPQPNEKARKSLRDKLNK